MCRWLGPVYPFPVCCKVFSISHLDHIGSLLRRIEAVEIFRHDPNHHIFIASCRPLSIDHSAIFFRKLMKSTFLNELFINFFGKVTDLVPARISNDFFVVFPIPKVWRGIRIGFKFVKHIIKLHKHFILFLIHFN